MHPAVSVIFFTVTSGAGLGLVFLIGLGWPMHEGLIPILLSCFLAGALTVAGLVSSTFHLGHPERAWRAFSQWRTSWLSREGVLAVLTLTLFTLYALLWALLDMRIALFGYVISLLAALTVYATAMIYVQLKTVPCWNRKLTALCYLLFALASGFLLAGTIGTARTIIHVPVPIMAAILVLIAWGFKIDWWGTMEKHDLASLGSTTGTATGLGHLGKVKLLEKPHSGENYLTREMVHRIGRKHARKLRLIALMFGLALPLLLCFLAYSSGLVTPLLLTAFLSMMAGLFVERWLFFAEARHSVSLYY